MAESTALPAAIWTMKMVNETPGAEEGEVLLYLMQNGSLAPSVKFGATGVSVKNAQGGWTNLMTATDMSKLFTTE